MCKLPNQNEGYNMEIASRRVIASKGFVSKKTNYFDKLSLSIWFLQLVVSYVIALS